MHLSPGVSTGLPGERVGQGQVPEAQEADRGMGGPEEERETGADLLCRVTLSPASLYDCHVHTGFDSEQMSSV
jgi:hypothetical protein